MEIKKIAFVSARSAYPFLIGGAEVSIHLLLKGLSERNIQCLALGILNNNSEYKEKQIDKLNHHYSIEYFKVNNKLPSKLVCTIKHNKNYTTKLNCLANFEDFFVKELYCFKPDIVLTHLDGASDTLRWCNREKMKCIHMLRDVFNPLNIIPFLFSQEHVNRPILTFSNSKYVQNYYKEKFGIKSEIMYPIIPEFFNDNIEKSGITFINPIPYKGSEIVFFLIKKLKKIEFNIIEGWNNAIDENWIESGNVNYYKKKKDISNILRKSKIVLVPTQGAEAFSRIALEAQSLRTAVIASKHSGLKESLNKSAFLVNDYKNKNEWLRIVKEIYNDSNRLNDLQKAGILNSKKYNEAIIIESFLKILQNKINYA